MKRMLFMRADLAHAISQRLAIYYKLDDAFPAYSADLVPKNLEGDNKFNDIIGPRNPSKSFFSVYQIILPQGAGRSLTMKPSDQDKMMSFEHHIAQIAAIQDIMLGITLVKSKTSVITTTDSETKTETSAAGLTTAMKTLMTEMWENTNIVSLILMSKRTATDIKDELNMAPLSVFAPTHLKHLETEEFFGGMFNTVLIGDGTNDKTMDAWRHTLDKTLNYTEVLNAIPQNGSNSFGFNEMMELLSSSEMKTTKRAVSKTGKDYAEKLISHLTTLDCLSQVEKVVNHFSPAPITQTFTAITREMNQLMLEMAQVEDLLAIRIFNSMQAWVALTQRTLLPYQRPEALEYVRHLFTNFANTYDIDGILNEFLALPIGKMSNEFVNKNEDVTSVTVKGTQLTTIISPYMSSAPEDGLDLFAGTIRQAVLSIYPLMKNKELWTLYAKGSLLAGGVQPTFKRVTRSLDSIPTVFSSFGSYAGNRLSCLDDLNWTMMFDWGINKFNSSSMTDVAWHDAKDDELLISLSHGQIDYHQYLNDYKRQLQNYVSNGVSGYKFSQQNIPLLAYRRRMLKSNTPFLGVDLSIIKLGGTSLLPVPPLNTNSVISDAKISFVDKQVIGAYETELERLPLNFQHTAPLMGDPISVHDSVIPQFLGISKINFDRSGSVGTTLLNRFTSKVGGQTSMLNCSTISEDPFFLSMVSHFFVSPLAWIQPKMHELFLRPFLRLDEGQEDVGAIMAKEIGVHQFIAGNVAAGRGVVGSRILTTCQALDRTDPLPRASQMGHLNPEHGTIED